MTTPNGVFLSLIKMVKASIVEEYQLLVDKLIKAHEELKGQNELLVEELNNLKKKPTYDYMLTGDVSIFAEKPKTILFSGPSYGLGRNCVDYVFRKSVSRGRFVDDNIVDERLQNCGMVTINCLDVLVGVLDNNYSINNYLIVPGYSGNHIGCEGSYIIVSDNEFYRDFPQLQSFETYVRAEQGSSTISYLHVPGENGLVDHLNMLKKIMEVSIIMKLLN